MRIIRRVVVTRTMQHVFRGGCCAGHHYTKQILLWEHLNVEEENGARLVVPVHDIAWRPRSHTKHRMKLRPRPIASAFKTSFDNFAVGQHDFTVV